MYIFKEIFFVLAPILKSFSVVSLFIGIYLPICSQATNLDSIIDARSHQDPKHSKYWESTVDLANYYVYHDLKKAEATIESVFSQYIDQGNQFDKCYHRHHLLRSWVHHGNNRLIEAVKHLSKAEDIVGNCGSRKESIEIQINKASLLIGSKDSTARRYVENYMTQIDTSIDKDEKVAWILGKIYLGNLDEERGFLRTALEHYLEVIQSGVLNEVKEYKLGIIKGIARTATELGDYDFALLKLEELSRDTSIYTYQHNNILIAKAINYYKKKDYDKISFITDEILVSDNVTNQDRIDTYWLRIKTYMQLNAKDKVYSELNEITSLKSKVQDPKILAKINLLIAEVSHMYGDQQETNLLLAEFNNQNGGNNVQNLSAEKLWLTNNIVGLIGQRLKGYIENSSSANKLKSAAQMQEMMAIYKVRHEKARSARLEEKLEGQKLINGQRIKAMALLAISSILTLFLWILSRRNTKIQKQLNKMLQNDKERLRDEQSKLQVDKEKLVFKNQELIDINQSLITSKEQKNITQPTDKLEVKTREKIHFIELSSIFYIKAENDGSKLFLENDKAIWTDSPLKNFVQELSDKGFVRIHRSVVVNLIQIEWINHATLKMNNGEELKVSRTYKDEILRLFKSHSPS